jgi:hypothetical protein
VRDGCRCGFEEFADGQPPLEEAGGGGAEAAATSEAFSLAPGLLSSGRRRYLLRDDEEVTVKRLYTEGNWVRRRAEDVRGKGPVVYVVHPCGKKA